MGSVRQLMTIHVLRPLAIALGVKGNSKIMRFTERMSPYSNMADV